MCIHTHTHDTQHTHGKHMPCTHDTHIYMPQGTHSPLMAYTHTHTMHTWQTHGTYTCHKAHTCSLMAHTDVTHTQYTRGKHVTHAHTQHTPMTHTHLAHTHAHTQHGYQAKRQKRQVTTCLLKPNTALKHSHCNYQLCRGNLHSRTAVWLFLTALCQRLWQTRKRLKIWHLSFWSPSWHKEMPAVTLLTLNHPLA